MRDWRYDGIDMSDDVWARSRVRGMAVRREERWEERHGCNEDGKDDEVGGEVGRYWWRAVRWGTTGTTTEGGRTVSVKIQRESEHVTETETGTESADESVSAR